MLLCRGITTGEWLEEDTRDYARGEIAHFRRLRCWAGSRWGGGWTEPQVRFWLGAARCGVIGRRRQAQLEQAQAQMHVSRLGRRGEQAVGVGVGMVAAVVASGQASKQAAAAVAVAERERKD
jgi:hypothetical protein